MPSEKRARVINGKPTYEYCKTCRSVRYHATNESAALLTRQKQPQESEM